MEIILGLLILVLFIALIIGCIKPSLILKWVDKPTRLKVVGYWFLSTVFTTILSFMFIDNNLDTESILKNADKNINEGNYVEAISLLKVVKTNDTLFHKASSLSKKADSLNKQSIKEKKITEQLEKLKNLKEQLLREIKSINDGITIADGDTVDKLQMDLVLFASWSKIIKEAQSSEDLEIRSLGNKLKSKVSRVQIKEFPKLRKQYTKIVSEKMWENDIEVSVTGTNRKYINFTGGIFAANKNKKVFQQRVQEILNMFRFKQSRYRWYKEESEYTYYTLYRGKDSDLFSF